MRLAGIAMVVLAMTLGVAVPAGASTPKPRSYVAMGDSYTSLAGFPIPKCERSPDAYPQLVATALAMKLSNRACTGASSANLLTTKQKGGGGLQISKVGTHTNLATILIGLNDLGALPDRLVGELYQCELANANAGTDQSCQTMPGMDAASLAAGLASARTNVAAALSYLHSNRPATKVFVLDYPALIGTTDCTSDAHLTPDDLVLYRSALDDLNAMLEQVAADAGDAFVDLHTPSLDAGGCPAWVAPATATGTIRLHPTIGGEAAMASVVQAAFS